MVASAQSRRVLQAVLNAYPQSGAIVGVSLERGWGGVLNVGIRGAADRSTGLHTDPKMREALRDAVADALPGERVHVTFTQT
jgi:hypothetical protein